MKLKMNKKDSNILVISHTSFSSTDSMGSTLASYFNNIEQTNIYQFYIKQMNPNVYKNAHYYRQTDREALKHCFMPWSKKYQGKQIYADDESTSSTIKDYDFSGKDLKKRYKNMLFRNAVWNISFCFNKKLKKWIKESKATKILLMPGDFSFLFKLTRKISKKYKIPVYILQCESYLLKPYFLKNISYRLYRHNFKKQYYSLMKYVEHNIYLCDELTKDYQLLFPKNNHITLMKSIDYNLKITPLSNRDDIFIYAGNLGELTGRCELLIKIAIVLEDLGFSLLVFTNSYGNQIEELKKIKNVSVYPSISKDKLIQEYQKHKYMLYIENFDPFHVEDLKYAFSTKIGDILCYGCVGVVIGSKMIAGINYLSEKHAGYIIESETNIESGIRILTNLSIHDQNQYILNSRHLLKINHDLSKNSVQFQFILNKTE